MENYVCVIQTSTAGKQCHAKQARPWFNHQNDVIG